MNKHIKNKIWRNLLSARYSIYYSLSWEKGRAAQEKNTRSERVLKSKRVWGFFMTETNKNVSAPFETEANRIHFAFYLFNPCEYNKNA